MENDNQSFIHLPSELHVEGNFKTSHSIKVECDFTGILFSKNKIIIESNSKFQGDIICSEIIVNGKIYGNIFCTGKVHAKQNCEISGSVYASRFENDESTNLDCVITVPKSQTIIKIKEILDSIDLNLNFNSDKNLSKLINSFKSNINMDEPEKIIGSPITLKIEEVSNKKVSVLGMPKWGK
jgi:cytoskeletal protein CcmA (bactofilin family)